MHGSVTKSMILRPEGAAYDRLLRDRKLATYERRQVVVDHSSIPSITRHPIIKFQPPEATMMKLNAHEADKANRRMEETEDGAADLRRRVFDAFSKADRIKQAELHAVCASSPGYTEKRLKDLLEKYAKYHAKGVHKHYWEILPEYRGSGSGSAVDAA